MDSIQKAAEILKNGGIVIFPTDTAFGIGCRIDDEKAVERLFALRKRPVSKATPVLASSLDMLRPFLQPIDEEIEEKLIQPYWPGGLTIVLRCLTQKVPAMVRNEDTLGVRVPNHPEVLQLIEKVGVPIIGTSANFAGEATPYRFEDLDRELVQLVDYVMPGETLSQKASTVIDCTKKPWNILREGAIELSLE